MSKPNKILILLLLAIPGIIVSYVLFFIIGNIIIPDECHYEMHETNWFIELLFDFPSWNGFHPHPSNFQFFLIFSFGIFLSYFISKKVLKY